MITHGRAPFLECSSKGDQRFSAFHARIRRRGGRSIEEIYQGAKVFADGSTGLSWRQAKGRRATNMAEVVRLYAALWDEFIAENPHLLQVLLQAPGLSDLFGQVGHCCQASELWRIRCAHAGQLAQSHAGGHAIGAADAQLSAQEAQKHAGEASTIACLERLGYGGLWAVRIEGAQAVPAPTHAEAQAACVLLNAEFTRRSVAGKAAGAARIVSWHAGPRAHGLGLEQFSRLLGTAFCE